MGERRRVTAKAERIEAANRADRERCRNRLEAAGEHVQDLALNRHIWRTTTAIAGSSAVVTQYPYFMYWVGAQYAQAACVAIRRLTESADKASQGHQLAGGGARAHRVGLAAAQDGTAALTAGGRQDPMRPPWTAPVRRRRARRDAARAAACAVADSPPRSTETDFSRPSTRHAPTQNSGRLGATNSIRCIQSAVIARRTSAVSSCEAATTLCDRCVSSGCHVHRGRQTKSLRDIRVAHVGDVAERRASRASPRPSKSACFRSETLAPLLQTSTASGTSRSLAAARACRPSANP
jgi:hypothetical protein